MTPSPAEPVTHAGPGVGRPRLTAGARAIHRIPVLGAVTGATTLAQVGAGALPVVVAVAAARAGSPGLTGPMLAAAAAGAFVGSLAWTWRPSRPAVAPAVVMVALAASGVPLVMAAWNPTVVVLTVALMVNGLANGPMVGALFVARTDHSPERLRGQVFTLAAGVRMTASAGGSALAGLVAPAATGVQVAAAGAVPVVAALIGGMILGRSGRS